MGWIGAQQRRHKPTGKSRKGFSQWKIIIIMKRIETGQTAQSMERAAVRIHPPAQAQTAASRKQVLPTATAIWTRIRKIQTTYGGRTIIPSKATARTQAARIPGSLSPAVPIPDKRARTAPIRTRPLHTMDMEAQTAPHTIHRQAAQTEHMARRPMEAM